MPAESHRRQVDLFASAALALLVLACYLPLVVSADRLDTTPGRVVASFALGAVYTISIMLGSDYCSRRGRGATLAYLIAECALLTAMIIVTPARGIFGIIVLPIVSQAAFELGWKAASLIIGYLFALVCGVIWWFHGASHALQVAFSYSAAFAFTIAFTIIGLRAHRARANAERLRAELEVANAQLRAHAAEAEKLATMQERNRLAREIHDGVGHYLTVIKVQLDAASALMSNDPARAADSVAKAARLAGEALDDVRRSVGTLAADHAPPPLTEALKQLVNDSSPTAALLIAGTPRPLGAAAEHALYRTAQEGLTNVRKHAHASAAELTLDFRDETRVRLTLVDNGRGSQAVAHSNGGYGLRGLRERIALLGGTMNASNGRDGGFTLAVEVPA